MTIKQTKPPETNKKRKNNNKKWENTSFDFNVLNNPGKGAVHTTNEINLNGIVIFSHI